MIETLLALLPTYGAVVVFLATMLGCVGVPAPASASLLAGGALVAMGKVELLPVVAAGLVGGLAGDALGFWLGVRGSRWTARLTEGSRAAERVARAQAVADRWGSLGVFLSRWALSPIGPVVNVLSGMAGMAWRRFAFWSVAGKLVWVGLFVGLGYAFSRSIVSIAATSGTAATMLVALVAVAMLALSFVPVLPLASRRRHGRRS